MAHALGVENKMMYYIVRKAWFVFCPVWISEDGVLVPRDHCSFLFDLALAWQTLTFSLVWEQGTGVHHISDLSEPFLLHI